MERFKVTVNNTAYEVVVEKLDGAPQNSAPEEPAKAPAAAPKAPVTDAGGTQIKAPMPGTIMSVQAHEGETVKQGQTLMVLEAMKMENEILSPCAGVVRRIHIQAGASVETGTLLAIVG